MPVNVGVLPFEFKVGALDVSENLTRLILQRPKTERGVPKAWTGSFSLVLLPSDSINKLNEFQSPDTWFPYQKKVTLKIDGQLIFTGYISQYRYNPSTEFGEGSLVDTLGLIDYLRPFVDLGIEPDSPKTITNLVQEALEVAKTDWSYVVPTLTGSINVPFSTSDIVREVQSLADRDRFWLYTNPDGNLRFQKYDLSASPIVDLDADDLLEFEPATELEPFVYEKVVVSGNKEVAYPVELSDAPGSIDEKGLPTKIVTVIRKTIGDIVGDFRVGTNFRSGGLDVNLVLEATKTIEIEYDDTGNEAKRTTKETKPAGWWLEDFRTGSSAKLGSLEGLTLLTVTTIEEPNKVTKIAPAGIVVQDFRNGNDSKLGTIPGTQLITAEEEVDNFSEEDYTQISRGSFGKVNVNSQDVLVPPPNLVGAPEYQIVSEFIEEEAFIDRPAGVQVFERVLFLDYQRLESKEQAGELANFWVKLEYARQFGYVIAVSPPVQWLQDPKPFFMVLVNGLPFIADDTELEISADRMVLRFTGNIGAPVPAVVGPTPPTIPPIFSPVVPWVSIRAHFTETSVGRADMLHQVNIIAQFTETSIGRADMRVVEWEFTETSIGIADMSTPAIIVANFTETSIGIARISTPIDIVAAFTETSAGVADLNFTPPIVAQFTETSIGLALLPSSVPIVAQFTETSIGIANLRVDTPIVAQFTETSIGIANLPQPVQTIEVVASAFQAASSGVSSITIPASTLAGDMIVITNFTVSNTQLAAPTGWTSLATQNPFSSYRMRLIYKVATALDANTTINLANNDGFDIFNTVTIIRASATIQLGAFENFVAKNQLDPTVTITPMQSDSTKRIIMAYAWNRTNGNKFIRIPSSTQLSSLNAETAFFGYVFGWQRDATVDFDTDLLQFNSPYTGVFEFYIN